MLHNWRSPRPPQKEFPAMSLLQLLFVVTYAATVAVLIRAASSKASTPWTLVALLAAAFIAFSVWTVIEDGLIQFWINHTTNLAGSQVWFDLLISVALAFILCCHGLGHKAWTSCPGPSRWRRPPASRFWS
jgi:hypothetical protein